MVGLILYRDFAVACRFDSQTSGVTKPLTNFYRTILYTLIPFCLCEVEETVGQQVLS